MPGDCSKITLAQGQSHKIWLVVSMLLHLGHRSLMLGREKVIN